MIKSLDKVYKIFLSVKGLYETKVRFFKEFLSADLWDEGACKKAMAYYLNILKRGIKEEKDEEKKVMSIVSELKEYLTSQLLSSPAKKELKYKELREAISLYHQIESCITVNLKQLRLLNEINGDPVKFNSKKEELFQLLRDEGRIMQQEGVHIAHIGEEEKETSKLPSFNWEYTIVGYGSLMNSAQIAGELCAISPEVKKQYEEYPKRTIRERLIPVIVYGWERIFTRRATSQKWTTPRNIRRKALAAMDISPSHRHYFNAVAIRVSKAELEQLYKREIDYRLTKLPYVRHFVTGEVIPNCICFKSPVAEQEEREMKKLDEELAEIEQGKTYFGGSKYKDMEFFKHRFIRSDMTPPPNYFKICVEGAKGLDSLLHTHGMYKTFLRTTYLYYIDRVLDRSGKKTNQYRYYGKFSVEDFLNFGYKLKGEQRLLKRFRVT